MSKLSKAVAGIGCLTLALGLALSGDEISLRLTNNTDRPEKVEVSRGKDASCQQNAAWNSVQIAAGAEILIPFDGNQYICWRVDGAGPNGGFTPWRAIACGLEKPTCTAVLFE